MSQQHILSAIRDFSKMVGLGLEHKQAAPPGFERVSNIVISGMGGSGIVGDIVRDAFEGTIKKPVLVNRKPTLPAFADESTLFIPVCYSGNTVETVAAIHEAIRRRCKVFGVTSGGSMKEILEGSGLPWANVRPGYASREALPLLLFPVVNLLTGLGLVEADLDVSELQDVGKAIDQAGGELATQLLGKTPIVCTTYPSVGQRFKSDLNENSKVIAKYELASEFCHNELNAWVNHNRRAHIVLLRDIFEPEAVSRMIDLSMGLSRVRCTEVTLEAPSVLSSILQMVWLGEFTSYYLAVMMGNDPSELPGTQKVREELRRDVGSGEGLMASRRVS